MFAVMILFKLNDFKYNVCVLIVPTINVFYSIILAELSTIPCESEADKSEHEDSGDVSVEIDFPCMY